MVYNNECELDGEVKRVFKEKISLTECSHELVHLL